MQTLEITSMREARLHLGLTQEELSGRCGVQRSTISAIECGLRNPGWKLRQTIAAELDISPFNVPGKTKA